MTKNEGENKPKVNNNNKNSANTKSNNNKSNNKTSSTDNKNINNNKNSNNKNTNKATNKTNSKNINNMNNNNTKTPDVKKDSKPNNNALANNNKHKQTTSTKNITNAKVTKNTTTKSATTSAKINDNKPNIATTKKDDNNKANKVTTPKPTDTADINTAAILNNSTNKKSKLPLIIIITSIIVAALLYIRANIKTEEEVIPEPPPPPQLAQFTEDMEISIGLSNIELTDELKSKINTIYTKADEFYTNYNKSLRLVSQYGFLYSIKNNINIISRDVLGSDNIGLSTKELDETDIIFIKPSDVGEVLEQDIKGNDLGVFVVINTKDGYYMVSEYLEPTLLTPKQYASLILKYNIDKGSLKNPKRNEQENTDILEAAMMIDYDIKHLACNEKYAVVLGNQISNPANIKEVVLAKIDNKWQVINDKLVDIADPAIYINNIYPDLETGIFPIYNIADFDQIDVESMTNGVNQSVIDTGIFTDADLSKGLYSAACGKFAYIEALATNKKLLGYIDDKGKLEFNEVADINSAISYMLSLEENPPVFILKFE